MTTEAAGGSVWLLRLMTWLSPAFPVGAFAFSHGLEAAIAAGQVRDEDTLVDWIDLLLSEGSGWNDLVLFSEAYRAVRSGDAARLAEAADLARALGGSAERREETMALGFAFARSAGPWDAGTGRPLADGAGDEDAAYPIAVARLAARNAVPMDAALRAFAHGFCANLVSAATRLVPLGQSAAVRATHRLEPAILSAAARAEASTPDDLGSAAILSDIAAMRHETLSTRLFRS